ncbi:MAG TPA: hypothetical protein PLS81_04335 [Deltaproteobacteria bacterium]|nr:hypothetical protein [Deltaproteobacteria bacterium]HOM28671.1 hypothetical protein [Deltaproteobacteria bacterium]HPP80460.1 hypothetical protein [Deltaproteobacteria bacterium]
MDLKADIVSLAVTAAVSLVAGGAIVLMVERIEPGLVTSRGQTFLFASIGVFAANLIIETIHSRMRR